MRNYILGVLTGVAGAVLYTMAPDLTWYFWGIFVISCALITFSFDVFFGSLQEHQSRAAWMGLGIFGGAGVACQVLVWSLGV